MTTHVVERIKTEILKDALVSMLMQRVTYQIPGSTESYLILAGLMTRLPDVFEIELESDDTSDILQLIMHTVNSISFRIPDIVKCPNCGTYVHRFNNIHIMCTNIDCTTDDYAEHVRIKLMTLLPSVPVNHVNEILEAMAVRNIDINVSNTIKFVKKLLLTNESGPATYILAAFVDSVSNITISQLLQTVIGTSVIDNLDKVIFNYNNQLIDMIDDLPTVLAPTHSLDVTSDIRILITMIMNSNKALLKQILPHWVKS